MFRLFFQKYKVEIIIFSVALGARLIALFFAVFYHGEQVLHLSDSSGFTDLAESLALGTGFSRDGGLTPHVLFVPGYPFFLAVSLFLFGSFGPALITQIFLSSLVPVMIFRIGSILEFSSKISFISAMYAAFEPHLVIFSIVYMTEALYGFLFAACVLFFAVFLKNGRWSGLFWMGGFLALAAYVKVSVYLVFVFAVALMFYLFFKKTGAKKIIVSATIFIVVFAVVLFPWFLRNYLHSGLWRFSSHEAYNLYVYDGASILSLRDGISYEDGKSARNNLWKEETGTEPSAVSGNLFLAEEMHKKGKKFVLDNIGSSVKLFMLTSFGFWTSHNYAYFLTYFFDIFEKPSYAIPPTQLLFQGKIGEAFYGTLKFITAPYYFVSLVGKILSFILAILSFLGVRFLYKYGDYRQKAFAILIGFVFAYFSIMAFGAGFGIEGRIRYPIEPFIILMAVVGANRFFKQQITS